MKNLKNLTKGGHVVMAALVAVTLGSLFFISANQVVKLTRASGQAQLAVATKVAGSTEPDGGCKMVGDVCYSEHKVGQLGAVSAVSQLAGTKGVTNKKPKIQTQSFTERMAHCKQQKSDKEKRTCFTHIAQDATEKALKKLPTGTLLNNNLQQENAMQSITTTGEFITDIGATSFSGRLPAQKEKLSSLKTLGPDNIYENDHVVKEAAYAANHDTTNYYEKGHAANAAKWVSYVVSISRTLDSLHKEKPASVQTVFGLGAFYSTLYTSLAAYYVRESINLGDSTRLSCSIIYRSLGLVKKAVNQNINLVQQVNSTNPEWTIQKQKILSIWTDALSGKKNIKKNIVRITDAEPAIASLTSPKYIYRVKQVNVFLAKAQEELTKRGFDPNNPMQPKAGNTCNEALVEKVKNTQIQQNACKNVSPDTHGFFVQSTVKKCCTPAGKKDGKWNGKWIDSYNWCAKALEKKPTTSQVGQQQSGGQYDCDKPSDYQKHEAECKALCTDYDSSARPWCKKPQAAKPKKDTDNLPYCVSRDEKTCNKTKSADMGSLDCFGTLSQCRQGREELLAQRKADTRKINSDITKAKENVQKKKRRLEALKNGGAEEEVITKQEQKVSKAKQKLSEAQKAKRELDKLASHVVKQPGACEDGDECDGYGQGSTYDKQIKACTDLECEAEAARREIRQYEHEKKVQKEKIQKYEKCLSSWTPDWFCGPKPTSPQEVKTPRDLEKKRKLADATNTNGTDMEQEAGVNNGFSDKQRHADNPDGIAPISKSAQQAPTYKYCGGIFPNECYESEKLCKEYTVFSGSCGEEVRLDKKTNRPAQQKIKYCRYQDISQCRDDLDGPKRADYQQSEGYIRKDKLEKLLADKKEKQDKKDDINALEGRDSRTITDKDTPGAKRETKFCGGVFSTTCYKTMPECLREEIISMSCKQIEPWNYGSTPDIKKKTTLCSENGTCISSTDPDKIEQLKKDGYTYNADDKAKGFPGRSKVVPTVPEPQYPTPTRSVKQSRSDGVLRQDKLNKLADMESKYKCTKELFPGSGKCSSREICGWWGCNTKEKAELEKYKSLRRKLTKTDRLEKGGETLTQTTPKPTTPIGGCPTEEVMKDGKCVPKSDPTPAPQPTEGCTDEQVKNAAGKCVAKPAPAPTPDPTQTCTAPNVLCQTTTTGKCMAKAACQKRLTERREAQTASECIIKGGVLQNGVCMQKTKACPSGKRACTEQGATPGACYTQAECQTLANANRKPSKAEAEYKAALEKLKRDEEARKKKMDEIKKKNEEAKKKALAAQKKAAADAKKKQAAQKKAMQKKLNKQKKEKKVYEVKCAISTSESKIEVGKSVEVKWSATPTIAVKQVAIKYHDNDHNAKEERSVGRNAGKTITPSKTGKYKAEVLVTGRFGKSCRDSVEFETTPKQGADTKPNVLYGTHRNVQPPPKPDNSWYGARPQQKQSGAAMSFARIYATPNPLYVGGEARLNWQGIGNCTINGQGVEAEAMQGNGDVQVKATRVFSHAGSYPYRLTCGSASDGIVIVVLNKPVNVPARAPAPLVSPSVNTILPPQVTERSTTSRCPVFTQYLKLGVINSHVRIVESFLKRYGYFGGVPDNSFGTDTELAVKGFQADHADVILTPWGHTSPTGYWYKTSRSYANKLMGCQDPTFNPDLGDIL